MTCQEIIDFFSLYWDQQLSAEERILVEGHLKECSTCQQEYQELTASLHFLYQNTPTCPVPEDLKERVLGQVHQLLFQKSRIPFLSIIVALVCFCIASLLFNSYLYFSSIRPPASSQENSSLLYDGQKWQSTETVVWEALSQKQVLEKVKAHPQFQHLLQETKMNSAFLENEHLKLKQEGLLLSRQEKEVLEKSLEQFSRLKPDSFENQENSLLASLLYNLTIGNGLLVQGFFFYPLFLDEDLQQSFSDFPTAFKQGKVKISAGEQPDQIRLHSFSSRPLFLRAGEVLAFVEGDYILKESAVLEPQNTLEMKVYSSVSAPNTSLTFRDHLFLPPSLVSLLDQSASFAQKVEELRQNLSRVTSQETSAFLAMMEQPDLQNTYQQMRQNFPYPQNPAPSGWVVLHQNQILCCEISASSEWVENTFSAFIQGVLLETIVHLKGKFEFQKTTWPPIKNNFVHKQLIADFLQRLVSLPQEYVAFHPKHTLIYLNPEQMIGHCLAFQEQVIQLQILRDPKSILDPQFQKLSPGNQLLWQKLLQNESIEQQDALVQKILARITEDEFQGLWGYVTQGFDLKAQQWIIRLLLKKRPKNSGKMLLSWLHHIWENNQIHQMNLPLIDALALVKYATALPLLQEILAQENTPQKIQKQCLEALGELYNSAPPNLQQEIPIALLQFGERAFRQMTNPNEDPLYQKLLGTFARISGQFGNDLEFYKKWYESR